MHKILTILTVFLLVFSVTLPVQAQDVTDADTSSETSDEADTAKEETGSEDPVREAQEKIDKVRKDVLEQRSRLIDGFQDGQEERAEKRDEAREDRAEKRDGLQTDRAEKLEERKAERETKMIERETQKAERIQEREAKMDERMALYVTRTEERFGAIINRLETLGARIDSRIEKLNERGVDTSEATALVDDGYASIANAETTLRTAIADLDSALTGESPREDIEAAKTLFGEAKSELREAHQSFVASIEALKEAVSEAQSE